MEIKGVKAISRLKNLRKLHLGNNYITQEGAKFISETRSSLRELNLANNNIGKEGAKFISRIENIQEFNLWNNNIGDEGAEFISRMKNLRVLNLGYNNIKIKGIEFISRTESPLRFLYLFPHNIEDKGRELLQSRLKNTIINF